ncbi:MAG: glycosyltransferase [Flavobacteriales bacterium]
MHPKFPWTKVILYLTYNDQPSGVYWSQVTDVVAHLNTLGGPQVRLVALVSARDYFGIRRKIRAHSPDAWVLPMVPQMKRWRSNAILVKTVCRLLRPSGMIARGALAAWMALRARDKGLLKKVCFDARGAYAAEWEEYRIIDDDALIAQFREVEQEVLDRSDLRIAVSNALVEHWRERYSYAQQEHVMIPCTLGRAHYWEPSAVEARREALGFVPKDVVLVYSGSTAGWQSFALLEGLLRPVLEAQPRTKVLFLCPPDPAIDKLAKDHLGRVLTTWVPPAEVPAVLQACDVALLVREDTITNRVASPTKFAEYLACGLPVIISESIGDFSSVVNEHGLGIVHAEGGMLPVLNRPNAEERVRCRDHAREHFTKEAHNAAYRKVMEVLA